MWAAYEGHDAAFSLSLSLLAMQIVEELISLCLSLVISPIVTLCPYSTENTYNILILIMYVVGMQIIEVECLK